MSALQKKQIQHQYIVKIEPLANCDNIISCQWVQVCVCAHVFVCVFVCKPYALIHIGAWTRKLLKARGYGVSPAALHTVTTQQHWGRDQRRAQATWQENDAMATRYTLVGEPVNDIIGRLKQYFLHISHKLADTEPPFTHTQNGEHTHIHTHTLSQKLFIICKINYNPLNI